MNTTEALNQAYEDAVLYGKGVVNVEDAKVNLLKWFEMVINKPIQPYQKQIIEVFEKGGKPSLRLRPTQSPKLTKRLLSGVHEIDELMKAGITRDELGTIHAILPKTRPNSFYMILDDIEAPYRSETK